MPTRELADWWTRAGAFVLDQLIVGATAYATLALGRAVASPGHTAQALLFYGVLVAIGLLYAPLLMARSGARNGQTLGKQAMGIRVVLADDGEAIGFWRGVLRTVLAQQLLIAVTVYVYGLVDYLWPIGDRRNQALHDKIANTLVVRAPAREAPRGQWLPPRAPGA